jgi:hypothetical protein
MKLESSQFLLSHRPSAGRGAIAGSGLLAARMCRKPDIAK